MIETVPDVESVLFVVILLVVETTIKKYALDLCIPLTNYIPGIAVDTATVDNRILIENVKRVIGLLVDVVCC
jgi:hypothetical protein